MENRKMKYCDCEENERIAVWVDSMCWECDNELSELQFKEIEKEVRKENEIIKKYLQEKNDERC